MSRMISHAASRPHRRLSVESWHETTARGLAVLNSPLLNKGSAFTADERKALGLTGLLPPDISTLAVQVKRAYIQYERLPDAVSKNIYLTTLHDRNRCPVLPATGRAPERDDPDRQRSHRRDGDGAIPP